jgi:hypothetical protein
VTLPEKKMLISDKRGLNLNMTNKSKMHVDFQNSADLKEFTTLLSEQIGKPNNNIFINELRLDGNSAQIQDGNVMISSDSKYVHFFAEEKSFFDDNIILNFLNVHIDDQPCLFKNIKLSNICQGRSHPPVEVNTFSWGELDRFDFYTGIEKYAEYSVKYVRAIIFRFKRRSIVFICDPSGTNLMKMEFLETGREDNFIEEFSLTLLSR